MLVTKFIGVAQTSTILNRYVGTLKLAELIRAISVIVEATCHNDTTTPRKLTRLLSKTAYRIITNKDFKCPQQFREPFKEIGVLDRAVQDECFVQLALLAGHQAETTWS